MKIVNKTNRILEIVIIGGKITDDLDSIDSGNCKLNPNESTEINVDVFPFVEIRDIS